MKPPLAQTKTDAAYREIRLAIESGELKPGERLVAHVLQDMLGMSPTPIREALRLLQRDGLVTHVAHHGTVVATLDEAMLMENSRIREVLEPLATELAARRATAQELDELDAIHQNLVDAVSREPAGPDVPRLNSEWHLRIYRASQIVLLVEFIERLWTVMGVTRYFSAHGPQALESHSAIMDALRARDGDAAAKLMLQHIREVKHDPRYSDGD